MGIPMLRECCCGCSLRTGVIVIGVLSEIFGLVCMGIGATYFQDESELQVLVDSLAEAAICLLIGALNIIGGTLLCVRAIEEVPKLLIPPMVATLLSVLENCISVPIMVIRNFASGNVAGAVCAIILLLIFPVVGLYFFVVIYSLYRQQKHGLIEY